jgi:hypothetical protein
MDKETIKRIKSWVEDFEKTQPGNVMIDDDTFEGSAYFIFQNLLTSEK